MSGSLPLVTANSVVATQRSGPYIWVTWLSKLLVGDAYCEWAAWFKTHYTEYARVPSSFNLAAWQVDHTAALKDVCAGLEAEGATVSLESQNHFRLRGSSGAILAGRPDIVASPEVVGSPQGRRTVYEVKTGAPTPADRVQVMIYIYALPNLPAYSGDEFDGKVVYQDHEVDIPGSAVDEAFKASLFSLIRRVANADPARRVPSRLECALCDLTAEDCPERVESDAPNDTATVKDF